MNARPQARGGVNSAKPMHTPGPWRIHETTTRIAIKSGNRAVAYVQISAAEEDNARLIAAAPDLLKLAQLYASECGECAGVGVTIDNRNCAVCTDIRDVIANAVQP